ncbi:MAG: PilC/PilY family type IV pilus protein, partial [Pseudomonadota bacterium]
DFYVPRYYTAAGNRIEIRSGSSYPGGAERDDCAGTGTTNTCTYLEEIQNFANWFQYYRSRELVAKSAIGGVVADLQDIRVGYETINRRTHEEVADLNEEYWSGEKKELLDTIYEVNSSGGTPLRRALDDAGRILGCNYSGRACPALPAPQGSCQQNFTLIFSDGYWNGPTISYGNTDSDGAGPFDGGKYADTQADVLADVAMHYYENDLFPAEPDDVPVTNADTRGVGPNVFTSTTMHQHVKTYTIAFGITGAVNIAAAEAADPTQPFTWPGVFSAATAKVDDMLHAAINGRGRFLNAGDPQELQTAIETAFLEFTQAASSTSAVAFNSTSLRSDTLLFRGFYDLRARTGELTATKVDVLTGQLALTPDWKASELLDASHPSGIPANSRTIATYDRVNRDGVPFRYANLNADQQAVMTNNMVDYIRGDRSFEQPAGNLRKRPDLSGLLGDIVNSSPIFVGEPRAFNRDQAPYPTGTGDFYSDFVNNVKARQALVYVGANDGMLHGFDAQTGREEVAYVPNLIMDQTLDNNNRLSSFTSSFYLHEYFVDLTPRFNDVYMSPDGSSGAQWLTALVGGIGAGGKGFYALNVTDPVVFGTEAGVANSVLWEFTDEDDTYPLRPDGTPLTDLAGNMLFDPLGKPVKDLGVSLSLPTIAMSNVSAAGEQRWVAIFGNGPNSTAGVATLFVLYMDGGFGGWTPNTDFIKIPTPAGPPIPPHPLAGTPNGLGSPSAVDIDLNGTVDLVYAGDYLGNLWRFDMRDPLPSNWKAVLVFTATYDDGVTVKEQPILSAPLVTKHPTKPGFLVSVGTGSFFSDADGRSTDIQSIYTIWDDIRVPLPYTAQPNSKNLRLVQQELENRVDDRVNPPQTRRVIPSANSVAYDEETPSSIGTYGWYVDLNMPRAALTTSGAPNPDLSGNPPPDAQFPGERAVRRLLVRDGNLFTTTVLPATDETSCFGARPGSILIFDIATGGDPGRPLIDFNLDGVIDDLDLVDGYSGGILFSYSDLDGALVDLSTLGGSGDTDFLFVSGGKDTKAYKTADLEDPKQGRQSWTQLREE